MARPQALEQNAVALACSPGTQLMRRAGPWAPNVRWVPPCSAGLGFSGLVGSAQTQHSGAGGAGDEGNFILRMRNLHPQPSGGPGLILPLTICP